MPRHPGGDAGARRRRPHRPALPHEHDAALPRRSRRRQGRRDVRGRPGAARASSGCSRSRRARPTSRPSCSAPISAARCPTRARAELTQADRPRPDAGRDLRRRPVGRGDQPAPGRVPRRAGAARWRRAGSRTRPPFFVRRSRVKIMDEIARLVGAQAALFVCGERPGLGFADSLSAYYIYQPAAGATDADREVISNINPRGRPPADAARRRRRRDRAHPAREEVGRRARASGATRMKLDLPPLQAARAGGADHPRRRDRARRARSACRPGGARWGSSPRPPTTRSSRRSIRGPRPRPPTSSTRSRSTPAPDYPSGPLSGECIGIYAARDPAEIDAALDACLAYLENEAWFYAATTAEDPDRPVAFFPARDRVGRALPGAAGRHRRRQPARLPDRAAARVDRRPRRRLQGGARARRQVVRPAVGDQLRRRLPGRRSARLRGGRARLRRRDRRRLRGARRAPLDPRRRRERSARPPRAPAPMATAAAGRFQALATGERFAEKPDHLTHLVDDASLVPKTHPRIVARGKLDLLQSAVLDAQVAADADGARGAGRRAGRDPRAGARAGRRRGDGPARCRRRRCSAWRSDELRDATHHTHELYGVPFMYPDVRQGPVVAKLSLARGDRARGRAGGASPRFPPTRGAVTAPPGARRSGPRAEPDLVGALPARLPLRRRPVRGQPPAARPRARLEAAAAEEAGEEGVSAQSAHEKQARLAKVYDDEIVARLRGALRGAAAAPRAPDAGRARRRDRLRDGPADARAGAPLRRQQPHHRVRRGARRSSPRRARKMDGVDDLPRPDRVARRRRRARCPADDASAEPGGLEPGGRRRRRSGRGRRGDRRACWRPGGTAVDHGAAARNLGRVPRPVPRRAARERQARAPGRARSPRRRACPTATRRRALAASRRAWSTSSVDGRALGDPVQERARVPLRAARRAGPAVAAGSGSPAAATTCRTSSSSPRRRSTPTSRAVRSRSPSSAPSPGARSAADARALRAGAADRVVRSPHAG